MKIFTTAFVGLVCLVLGTYLGFFTKDFINSVELLSLSVLLANSLEKDK